MGKRILYVEDNPQNRLLVGRILEADGHQMFWASDGEGGWATAVAQRPDLILMDLHLPGSINGLALTRRLKASPHLGHIPIIALTAFDGAATEDAARDAGCDAFLTKPADIRQVRAALNTFLLPDFLPPDSAPRYTFI